MSMNLVDYNQVNDDIENKLKFDISSSLVNIYLNYPLPIVNISLIGGNKSKHTLRSGLTCWCYSGATDSMIKCKYINTYKFKIRSNKVK